DAVDRYGPNYSSSTVYTALGLNGELESLLGEIFGAAALVAPTTTLAHLGALPVLALPGDLVLIDISAHATLHLAADVLRGRGVEVETLPHNSVAALQDRLAAAGDDYRKIWYLADGLYSMFGDFAPVKAIAPLLDEHPNLFLYYDDAHAVGWKGQHGRGHVLSEMEWHPRLVVAAGLAKSFGAHGAVLAFGDETLRETVLLTGSSWTFSGPIQVASLGAAVASARIHLSHEIAVRQAELDHQISWFRNVLLDSGLPVVGLDQSPIWYVKIGATDDAVRTVRQLLDDSFYVNTAGYPAVPFRQAGIRFTQTLHHTREQLLALVDAMTARIATPDVKVEIDLRDHARPEPSLQPHS
ncbi:MAG: aminotransferase class I/II-fold pyridoxal phosphate-dependent enzyme, partial [Acidimicrobiia bacterium]|nr:aminotransferase class I/II-fold pyridoxal phosphate-dependent enzyme [Acidimicrobiia bacterium]